jgi:hypothetical protein
MTYETRVERQMATCQEMMNYLALSENKPEKIEMVRQEMAGLRENLREARLGMVRMLCAEVRRLLEATYVC